MITCSSVWGDAADDVTSSVSILWSPAADAPWLAASPEEAVAASAPLCCDSLELSVSASLPPCGVVVGVGGRVERSMLHSSFSVVVTSLLSSESGNTGLSVSATKEEKFKNSGYSVHVALHQPDYQIKIVKGK